MSFPASTRPAFAAFAATCAVLLLAACASVPPASSATTTAASSPTVDRLIDIDAGRQLHLNCRGTGSPVVVLTSGTGGAADEWMSVAAKTDPAAPPAPSSRSVFDTLARTGRVCAYDRPGTTLLSDAIAPSTLVPQPTTAAQGVADLDALLRAAHQPGPFVLVGASWGGMIAQLFARARPNEIRGIVLVDAASAYLKNALTARQWTGWMTTIAAAHAAAPNLESPDYDTSVAELQAARAMPHIAAAVPSSDRPWDLRVTPGASTWPAWLEAQRRLASSLHAVHISDTNSGHGIAVEQPALVASAVRRVIAQSR
ncbi:alpha/beta hydrolase [Humibacter antri]